MKALWERAEKAAVEVASWPEWKRAGIDIASQRSEPRAVLPEFGESDAER